MSAASRVAGNADEAWFAAGALHGRDRLWQMGLYRRVTQGRLSAGMGEPTLPIDRRFLTLGLRQAAADSGRVPCNRRLGGAGRSRGLVGLDPSGLVGLGDTVASRGNARLARRAGVAEAGSQTRQ